MNALGNNLAFWLAIINGLAVMFLLPTIIGTTRQIEHLGIVIGLNFIPILWPAALLGAFMLPRRRPRWNWQPPQHDQGQHVLPRGPYYGR
jgi:hypothetical protein